MFDLIDPTSGDVIASESCPGNAAELAMAYSEVHGMHLVVVERELEQDQNWLALKEEDNL